MSNYPGLVGPNGVGPRQPLAKVGAWVNSSPLNYAETLVNTDPQALQVYTCTVTSPATNAHEYIITIDGVEISSTLTGTTAADVVTGWVALIQANSQVRGLFVPSAASNVLTLTAVNFGTDILVSDADALIATVETVAPGAANVVYFGRGVMDLQTQGSSGNEFGSVVHDSALVAQVDTLTIVYAALEYYAIEIAVAGQVPVGVSVLADTSTAVTTTAIVAAINARMPAETVLAASSVAGTITLTAEKAGLAFVTSINNTAGTASRLGLALTTSGPLTDINQCFAGTALLSYAQATSTVGSPANYWPANSAMAVAQQGPVWVYSEETPTTSSKVWVETAAGDDAGKFYTSSSSTRLQILGASWRPRATYATGQNLNQLLLSVR